MTTNANGAPVSRRWFGTDGVRGTAGVSPMTAPFALALGAALVRGLRRPQQSLVPRVVVGKDTRLSCDMLEAAFAAGVCAAGGHVLSLGVVPTPAVALLTLREQAQAGVVISASHNPFADNGIKLFGADGFKLSDADEAAIEAEVTAILGAVDLNQVELGEPRWATAEGIGRIKNAPEAAARYSSALRSALKPGLSLRGMSLVVDAANGAASALAPQLFTDLGATVIALGCEPSGSNINRGVGALHPEGLAAAVREHGAQLGIALDGDADRLILVDERGDVADGDVVLAVCGTHLAPQGLLRGNAVVATIMSNLGLEIALRRVGAGLVRTAVGDRYVVAEMKNRGIALGGEQSGHLVFLDHATTGDGLLAALKLLEIMAELGKPLSELRHVFAPMPQVLRSVRLRERRAVSAMPALQRAMRGAEQQLGNDGRVVVRWSGTEPLLRLMLEGPDEGTLQTLVQELARAAESDVSP